MHPIEIIGGGLAGLALGCGLRTQGVPVTVRESGTYPRHRTCGEFMHGLEPGLPERLGLGGVMEDIPSRDTVSWHHAGSRPRRLRLSRPARIVDRHLFDARLAARFEALGGNLETGSRVDRDAVAPGRVFACGRQADRHSAWYGLKVHLNHLELEADLEFHVGRRGYVGLCRLRSGEVNLCGVFHRGARLASCPTPGIAAHLAAVGLESLAARVASVATVKGSMCAVGGLRFGLQPRLPGSAAVGDAFAFAPPYTGRGMAGALAGAAAAVAPLAAWSRGARDWEETTRVLDERLRLLHRRGLSRARRLHRFLLHPPSARLAAVLLRAGTPALRLLSAHLNPPWPPACFSTP